MSWSPMVLRRPLLSRLVDSIGRRNTLIMEVLDDGNSRLGQEDQ